MGGRTCCQCGEWKSNYSSNQWRKGDGSSRCVDCVDGVHYVSITCDVCRRSFNTQNELNMHMQVHRPKTVSCPVCSVQRFRSAANAVQHVESGYCTGCVGRDNAREQIYKFASGTRQMQQFVTQHPMLEYGDYTDSGVPDYPYQCPQCDTCYRNLSQLMQHQDQRHGNQLRLGN